MPFTLNITVSPGRTSWKKSRSAVTITASIPRSSARSARVAIASSASWPSMPITGILRVSSTSTINPSCCRNSSGVSARPALYSAYFSSRTVGLPTSNATAIRSGFSSASSLISIEVNPYTALVTCPEVVANDVGRAKNARYERLWPSRRNSRLGGSAARGVTRGILARRTDRQDPGVTGDTSFGTERP